MMINIVREYIKTNRIAEFELLIDDVILEKYDFVKYYKPIRDAYDRHSAISKQFMKDRELGLVFPELKFSCTLNHENASDLISRYFPIYDDIKGWVTFELHKGIFISNEGEGWGFHKYPRLI